MFTNNRVQPTAITLEKPDETEILQTSTVTFKSVNYYINTQESCEACNLPCLKKTPKQILTHLSGIFQTGMNAIMGPSGCGKSSLLDLLADRKDKTGFEGEILVNGQRRGENYKYQVGYVVQDDIVCGNLTVKENLMFSANVRLSIDLSSKEKEKIVDDVISQLGLQKCANTPIGTDFKRGVSGGERKRTNIGMELILSPKILFLDEPTTGLDSTMARNVMECLHQLSRQGRTIVFSIHQPRYSIFKLFDTLYLLAAGRCIYHGPTNGVLQFLSSAGFPCEQHNNPADFILDVSQGDRVPEKAQADDNVDPDSKTKRIEVYLNQEYIKTDIYKSIQTQISEKTQLPTEDSNGVVQLVKKSRWNDLFYVCQRTLRNSFRDPVLSILQIAISMILGVLVGLIYLNMALTTTTGVKNRNGAIFFIVANQVFSNLSALEVFIKERVLFVHENASGYYHVVTYFFAKIVCDIIPLRTIPAATFSIIAYFMMGLQKAVDKFFIFFFFVWLTSICATSLCFLVSASIRNFGVANLVATLYCVLTLIFSGFLVEISSVLAFLRWIQYFSIFRYGSDALLINEFMGLTLCLPNNSSSCTTTGADVLSNFSIDHGTDWDLWLNCVALMSLILGFFTLTYIQLLRMKKTK